MTELITAAIRGKGRSEASALNFVCGALIAYDASRGRSPFEGLDVERVFAAVELLAERRKLEITPFVASWHPAVDAWDQRAPQTSSGTYSELTKLMLEELRTLVGTTPETVEYLRPLVSAARRAGGLAIATLNYDISVEQAADVAGIPVTTGIKDWIGTGSWNWPDTGVRLLKLHGSIDWMWDVQRRPGHLPRKVLLNAADDPWGRVSFRLPKPPALIFGQRAKLRAEGPFLSLLAEFERELSAVRRLIVIGYSFRDDHINEIIRRWTAEDDARTLLVVDPNWDAGMAIFSGDLFPAQLESHLVPRLRSKARNFPSRLMVWRKPCSEALLKLAKPEESP